MKWSVVGLVVVGVIAALCASILVGALKAPVGMGALGNQDREVQILIAANDLPASHVITKDDVVTRPVKVVDVGDAIAGDETKVVGRTLIREVKKNERFSEVLFATGAAELLPTYLPKGMRAMAVALSDDSALLGLLAPGSLVDVLVTYRTNERAMPTSKTLLQGITVLAIEQQTIVSPKEEQRGEDAQSQNNRVSRGNKQMVTLQVRPDQAEILQAAKDTGTIALTLRSKNEPVPQIIFPSDPLVVQGAPPRMWNVDMLKPGVKERLSFPYSGEKP